MAVSRYIEGRDGETWAAVSELFANWVLANAESNRFGWSEGDSISLENGAVLLCFRIPDHHRSKFKLFEEWAESTDRLYGIADGQTVTFPHMPELTVLLPPPKEFSVPPWLR